jgi:ABC-2 type transport system ATP-binding protein
MISATDLSKRFSEAGPPAVDGLSFDVRPGEIVGFVGENGAGKTTTLRMLIGLLRPSGGRAEIAGFDCQRDPVRVRAVTGFAADEPFLYDFLTPLEHARFLSELRGLDVRDALARARELLDFLGFPAGLLDAPTVQLSLGNKKKVVLALALCPRPQVLLLDEPTNALDPEVARRFRLLLDKFAKDGGAVLLSTHLLDMAERLCHRVLVVQRGRRVAMGTAADLRQRCGLPDDATLEDLFFSLTGTGGNTATGVTGG